MKLLLTVSAFLLFSASLLAQNGVPVIESAHGVDESVRTSTILVRGTAAVGGQRLPFTLHLRGGDSRLQIGERVTVHAEGLRQQVTGGRPGRVEHPFPGLRDTFLMPFGNVGRLAADFTPGGRQAGRNRFQAQEKRRRFLSAQPEDHHILLEFDAQSALLAQASAVSPEGQPDVVYLYSDYRSVQGLQVPHRVERRLGGATVLILEAEAVELNPNSQPSDFHIVHPVSSR